MHTLKKLFIKYVSYKWSAIDTKNNFYYAKEKLSESPKKKILKLILR